MEIEGLDIDGFDVKLLACWVACWVANFCCIVFMSSWLPLEGSVASMCYCDCSSRSLVLTLDWVFTREEDWMTASEVARPS